MRLGPYALELPEGFQADGQLGEGDTAALAVTAGDGERRLLGYFHTGDPLPVTLALSEVQAPLVLDPSSKPVLAAAVEGHFKQLDLRFTLERTRWVKTPAARVEVWGSVSIEGKDRVLCVAFYPGRQRHAVAVASLPAARATSLEPQIEAALGSVRHDEPPEPLATRRTVISVAVWGAAAITFVLARLYRKRRAAREQSAA